MTLVEFFIAILGFVLGYYVASHWLATGQAA
jgi:hypothetical protein